MQGNYFQTTVFPFKTFTSLNVYFKIYTQGVFSIEDSLKVWDGIYTFRYNLKSNKMKNINPRWAIVVVLILAILLNYYNSTR